MARTKLKDKHIRKPPSGSRKPKVERMPTMQSLGITETGSDGWKPIVLIARDTKRTVQQERDRLKALRDLGKTERQFFEDERGNKREYWRRKR